jgi:hypothetical protein
VRSLSFAGKFHTPPMDDFIMAENKKSFVLYSDIIHTLEELSDDEAGRLIKHILRYVNDKNPETNDRIIKIAFEPIKHQLKRDLVKWDIERGHRSDSGRLGGIKSGETRRKQKEANEASASKTKQTEANEAVTVNVTVNGTVNTEIQNNTVKGEKHFQSLKDFYSHPYEKQFDGFKKENTKNEYEQFQKFLGAMFRDFEMTELTSNFDKCLGIGDWKRHLRGSGFMLLKPAISKAIASKEGNRDNMALRILTFTNGIFDEKVLIR